MNPDRPLWVTVCAIAGVAVVAVGIAASACTASQARQVASAGTVAFLDCETAHLDAQALADARLFADAKVQQWIGGAAAPDSARIRADLAPIKSDLGRCAIASALAAATALLTPPTPGEAISALSSSSPAPAAVRAQFQIGARLAGWPLVKPTGGDAL